MAVDEEMVQEEATASNGTPEGVNQEAGGEDQDRQPTAAAQINLDDHPSFRKWKSTMDKQIGDLRAQMTQAERRAWDAEQRLHQSRMETMDESQRKDYQIQLLQQQLEELGRRDQLREFAFQKESDIRKVAQKKGLDYEELVEALPQGADSFVLWEVAEDLAEKKQAQAKTPKAAQVNNTVDLGNSKPSGEATRLQNRLDQARKNYDSMALFDIMAEAAEKGIELR